jgi:hypothetical protein
MDHEITQTVKHNSQSNEEFIVQTSFDAIIKQYDTWNSKNDKKDIIPFKNIRVFWLMMISMEVPH